ncbi:MAG: RNA 2',3'-cyclic phosphodiesterase [Betaproteobacteria bacterium]
MTSPDPSPDAVAPPTQRVFFAAWPDDGTRVALAALAEGLARETEGRATDAGRLHLTLAFVGNVLSGQVTTLIALARSVAQNAAPFVLPLDRSGMFRVAGIAWAGASITPPLLTRLVSGLRLDLQRHSFEIDRRDYRAHVTLARRCRRMPPSRGEMTAIDWQVDTMTLTASELTPQGPRYSTLAQWPLGR